MSNPDLDREQVFAEIERRAAADGLDVYCHKSEPTAIIALLSYPKSREGFAAVTLSGIEPKSLELVNSRYESAARVLKNNLTAP